MAVSMHSPTRTSLHVDLPSSRRKNLESKAPTTGGPRLRDLEARVVNSLLNSGYAALRLVGCDVEHDGVILHGVVPSYHLKQLAQVCALRVEGISRIENRLKVQGR